MISVVLPAHNVVLPAHHEADGLAPSADVVAPATDARGVPYETILVENGSTDRTPELASVDGASHINGVAGARELAEEP